MKLKNALGYIAGKKNLRIEYFALRKKLINNMGIWNNSFAIPSEKKENNRTKFSGA